MPRALTVIGGVLLLAMAFPHALLGWPAMQAALGAVGASRDLQQGLAAGWYWGSVMMAAAGCATIVAGRALPRDGTAKAVVIILGGGVLLFGLAATISGGFDTHFLGFILTGCLILTGGVFTRRGRSMA